MTLSTLWPVSVLVRWWKARHPGPRVSPPINGPADAVAGTLAMPLRAVDPEPPPEPAPVTDAPSVIEPVVAPDVSAQGMVFVTGIVKPPVGSPWVTPLNARPHQVRRPHEGDA